MSVKLMRKQISLPVALASSKQDSNGEKDVHPLLKISQPNGNVEVKKKILSKTSKSLDYEQPIHPIPSSQITLNEEEKLELEYVLFLETLDSIGLR